MRIKGWCSFNVKVGVPKRVGGLFSKRFREDGHFSRAIKGELLFQAIRVGFSDLGTVHFQCEG